jgi:predicted GNAT superfamily acetyltransferase
MSADSHGPSSSGKSTTASVAYDPSEISIRPLVSREDYDECYELQNAVWGGDYTDSVPASLFKVIAHAGGLVVGAFAPNGEMVGFVFSLVGKKNGEIIHWSHLLGVKESARDAGVGRTLKEYQRAELHRQGIAHMYWTFDPLLAKNAHLNLNRLGARAVEYVRDMYGSTGSPLHHGLVTDRLVVMCDTAPRTTPLTSGSSQADTASAGRIPVLSAEPQAGDVLLTAETARPPVIWIEVPTDINRVAAISPHAAAAWQASLRKHFEWALSNGYQATRLHRDAVAGRSFYVLEMM